MLNTDNRFPYDKGMLRELGQVKLGYIALFVPRNLGFYKQDTATEQLLKDTITRVMGRFEIQRIETYIGPMEWCIAVRKPSLLDTTRPTYAVIQGWRVQDSQHAANFLRQQLFDILPNEHKLITLYEPPVDNINSLTSSPCCASIDESEDLVDYYDDWSDKNLSYNPEPRFESVSLASHIRDWFSKSEKKPRKKAQVKKHPDISESIEISAIDQEREKWLDALQQFTLAYVQQFHEMPPMAEIEQRVRGMMLLPSPKCAELSRIKINGDFHIFLPDYDELELRMTPLVRTLYIFFLLHPEGVALRFIPDYAAELTRIYSYVKPGADEDLAQRSIESLIDPFSESLQQKLSMSRRAIREQIPIPEIAKHYMINGTPGGVYRINIDTGLVNLPKFLINS